MLVLGSMQTKVVVITKVWLKLIHPFVFVQNIFLPVETSDPVGMLLLPFAIWHFQIFEMDECVSFAVKTLSILDHLRFLSRYFCPAIWRMVLWGSKIILYANVTYFTGFENFIFNRNPFKYLDFSTVVNSFLKYSSYSEKVVISTFKSSSFIPSTLGSTFLKEMPIISICRQVPYSKINNGGLDAVTIYIEKSSTQLVVLLLVQIAPLTGIFPVLFDQENMYLCTCPRRSYLFCSPFYIILARIFRDSVVLIDFQL